MDKSTEMTIFVHAVEAGGFSAAARLLDLTPSAVSKRIRRLEDRLRTRLFHRTTRRIHLTDAGQNFYRRCSSILRAIEEVEDAVSSMSTEPWGTLRVAATVSFGRVEVLPLINDFITGYPQIRVDLELTDRHVDLVNDGMDVAIQLAGCPDISAGPLHAVLPQYPQDYSAFYVVYPHRRHLSRKVRAFVDFLIEKFTPVPHWERTTALHPST